MSDWEVVPDAPAPAPAAREWSVVPDEATPAAPALHPRSFLDRASFAIHHPIDSLKEETALVGDAATRAPGEIAQSFKAFGGTLAKAGKGALGLVSPVNNEGGFHVPFSQLSQAPYRHELERGVSDTVTAGLAEKAANAVSPAFASTATSDALAAPGARVLGQVAGTALPSPFTRLAEGAGKLIPGTGPLASAAKGVAGYEAAAIPQAAIAAPTGHRLEAAREAATDPASLATAAGLPAVTSYLQKRLAVAAEKAPAIQESAKRRAVKDLGQDITSADGAKATSTDQKKIAQVNDRLYDLADKNPELRQAFSEPAEKAIPKIRAFKERIAKPLATLDDALDQHTGGGLDPAQVVNEFRDMAREEERSVSGLDDAKRLNDVADRFEQVYITNRQGEGGRSPATQAHGIGKPPIRDEKFFQDAYDEFGGHAPTVVEGAPLGELQDVEQRTRKGGKGAPTVEDVRSAPGATFTPEQIQEQIAGLRAARDNARGAAARGIDEQIGKLEAEATAPPSAGTAPRIPTRVFRQEVTDMLKKSESIMGGLEGTPRYEALQRLYAAGKKIVDKHIDTSGLPPDQIAQIRDINNGYFLASRAEEAIDSRGWKEANRPGFKLPHTLAAAVHSPAGLGGIAGAVAYGASHPHAIPFMAGTVALAKGLPAAAKAINWDLAHGAYTRAVSRLIAVARSVPKAAFIGQAARAGLPDREAARIYDAANKQKTQEATP